MGKVVQFKRPEVAPQTTDDYLRQMMENGNGDIFVCSSTMPEPLRAQIASAMIALHFGDLELASAYLEYAMTDQMDMLRGHLYEAVARDRGSNARLAALNDV
jgi:hypothetical protein